MSSLAICNFRIVTSLSSVLSGEQPTYLKYIIFMRLIHLSFLFVYLYNKLYEALNQDLCVFLKCNFLQKREISQLRAVANSCLTHLVITVVSLKLICAEVCCELSAEIWCAVRISQKYFSEVYVIHISLNHSK